MSGSNPFRRSKIITSPSITTSSTDESVVLPSIPNDAITSGASSVGGNIKTQSSSHPNIGRIATPPPPLQQQSSSPPPTDSTSSSYFPAVSFAGLTTAHRGSPPPSPLPQLTQPPEQDGYISSDDSESDPFDPRSSDGVVIDHPVTPQRRLPSAEQSVEDGTTFTSRTAPRKETKPTNTLDVDAFTRLLLTGSADAASTTTSTTTAGRRTASNPDTVLATTAIESPNRAQTWASTDDSFNQEMRQTSPQATTAIPRASTFSTTPASNDIQRTPSLRKPKPPPPRSHHGKPIKPDDSAKDTSTSSTSTPIGSTSDRRGSTSSLSVKVSSPNNEPPSIADEVSSLHQSSFQSKRPPTPPLARRHSQMRPNTNRHPIAEKPNRLSLPPKSLSSHMQGPLSPGSGTKTPPRPPSRRVERPVSGIQGDATISQLKSSLSQSESTPSDQLSVDEQTTQAPATSSPPSRTPSIKQSLPGSATTTGMLPPPPPPPRRLRASSKSSNTTVSVSIDKTDAPATTEQEDTQSSSQAQDILADLSRLQREVDEMRVHYEGRKVSQ